jgi:tRNA A58 N-methylase Trm61
MSSTAIDKISNRNAGEQALYSLKDAHQYNRWLIQQFSPFVGKRIMELGAGIGNMAQYFLDKDLLLLMERDEDHLELLRKRFELNPNVKIVAGDLESPALTDLLSKEAIDTLICLNVMEHLVDDVTFLKRLHERMNPSQHLILAVPQHPWLYSRFDHLVEHQRRYSMHDLESKLMGAGFEIDDLRSFNRIGCLGWLVRFRLLRQISMSRSSTWIFNVGVPIWRIVEHLSFLPALSLIAVVRPRK